MKENVIETVRREKIIVIVRGVERERLIPLAKAMYDGGIRLIEITFDASGKISDTETAENIKMLSECFEGKMLVGAGTVLNTEQVWLAARSGAKFIISPDTNPDVIRKTVSLGLASMPGALTPTEIMTAYNSGADFVKLFPVTSLGADYIKAVSAPLSNVRFMAVGGVDLSNIGDYLKAGVCGFGIGSNIVDKSLLKNGDYRGITELAKRYVSEVKRI